MACVPCVPTLCGRNWQSLWLIFVFRIDLIEHPFLSFRVPLVTVILVLTMLVSLAKWLILVFSGTLVWFSYL